MNIELRDFTELSIQSHEKIISYRNDDRVRNQMNTTSQITLENHLSFIEKLKKDNNNKYWLVVETLTNQDIGVVYLNRLQEEKVYLGIYANLNCNISNKGKLMMQFLEDKAFIEYNLKSLYLEVKKDNYKARGLYDNMGYNVVSESDNLIIMVKRVV